MKRAELFHPRIFDDKEWAKGYYKRNAKNIENVGKRFVELLKVSGFKKGRILDAGCGFGAVAIQIVKNFPGTEIIGIDMGEPLLVLAEDLAKKEDVNDSIEFRKGDVQITGFEENEFDLVINTFMLHVVEDPVLMLNEIERVTKPQGIIMITDLRRIWLARLVKKLKTAFTLDEAVEIINKSNLRNGKAKNGPFYWDYLAGI